MATLNSRYHLPEDEPLYSDGLIEKDMLAMVESGQTDWFEDGRWPVVYHLSHLRRNILNWYPFRPGCAILEIGAGLGAITGLLCERAQRVVAIELTQARAEINYQRNKGFDNLEIMVCDFSRLPATADFDYVVVNGVLEYAAYMMKSEDPYAEFLRRASMFLKPDGRILLAIENRLGLKYLSGAREDHTGIFYSGINGYKAGESVRTFSKPELIDKIGLAGLTALKFFYPYPDYKFPAEIFTDSTLFSQAPSVAEYPLDSIRVKLFDEKSLYESLMKTGTLDHFVNSFFVEVAQDGRLAPVPIAYAKISANRKAAFRICTYYDESRRFVYKQPLCKEGRAHLERMHRESGVRRGDFINVSGSLEDGRLVFPYIDGESFESGLIRSIRTGNPSNFLEQVRGLRDALYRTGDLSSGTYGEDFSSVFGDRRCDLAMHWSENVNIDMVAGNLFGSGGEYRIIDYEWHMPFPVPLEFALWRMLKQFMQAHASQLGLTDSGIRGLIGIDESTEACFSAWETHFAVEHVGMVDLHRLSCDVIPIDLEEAIQKYLADRVVYGTLFIDIGQGYSDRLFERQKAAYTPTGFVIEFTDERIRQARSVRWDPLEGQACRIRIDRIETDGTVTAIVPIGSEEGGGDAGYEFLTYDPQIDLIGDFSKATRLRISYTCTILDWRKGYVKRDLEIGRLDGDIRNLRTLLSDIRKDVRSGRFIKAWKRLSRKPDGSD